LQAETLTGKIRLLKQAFLSKYGVFGPPLCYSFPLNGDLINVRQGEMDLAQLTACCN